MTELHSLQGGLQKSFDPTFGNYLLHGIEEVYLPETIAWWPHTLGWKVLLVGLVCCLALLVIRGQRKWQANRYRRQGLVQLEEIRQAQSSLVDQGDDTAKRKALQQLPTLLKVTALQAYPRNEIAQLSGAAWLRYLNESCQTDCFDAPTGALLLAIDYQAAEYWSSEQEQLDALFHSCQQWIQQHRTELEQSGIKRSSLTKVVVKRRQRV